MTPQFSIAAGWMGILFCFVTGMMIGLLSVNDAWLGGYADKARRYMRLGHIACAALGIINILAGLCALNGFLISETALICLLVGLITMPIACWITVFTPKGFHLFPIPSLSLMAGAILILKDVL